MSVNQIIGDFPTLIGIGLTSGFASSLLTSFLTPRIQHRFWVRQQRFDSRFSNLKELHRVAAEIGKFVTDYKWPLKDNRETIRDALVHSWLAAIHQTAFLFSEKAINDVDELTMAILAASLHGSSTTTKSEAVNNFLTAQRIVFVSLYKELFAR
jgi:hypothetical protein